MTDQTNLPPIRKTVWVPLPPEQAFDLFTRDIDKWWPVAQFSIAAQSGATPRDLQSAPAADGEIVETLDDGAEHVWGRFTIWEPPHHAEIAWHVGQTIQDATRIELRFMPSGNGTELILIHDGFEIRGEAAGAGHEMYNSGWNMVLDTYRCAA